MVAGYFAANSREKFNAKIKRTAISLIVYVGIYFIYNLLIKFLSGDISTFIFQTFTLMLPIEILFLNTGLLLGHLWFLMALLWCYVIHAYILKHYNKRFLFVLSISLLIIHFALHCVLTILEIKNPTSYTRNFLFTGLPFYLFGNLFNRKNKQNKPIFLACIALSGVILSFVEFTLLGMRDLYIGSCITVISIFGLLICIPNYSKKQSHVLDELLPSTVLDMYVWHVMLISIVNIAAVIVGVYYTTFFPYVRPIIIIGVIVVFTELRLKIKSALKSTRR